MQLYSRIATEFSLGAIGNTGVHLRDLVDSDRLLFILREHYDLAVVVLTSSSSEADQREREVRETRAHVRPYLLLILRSYFTKVSSSFGLCWT